MAACGACHDNVNFATGENHRDIVQTSNKECILCHQSEGEIEFDGSVTGAHTIPAFSKELPGVVIATEEHHQHRARREADGDLHA